MEEIIWERLKSLDSKDLNFIQYYKTVSTIIEKALPREASRNTFTQN